MTVNFEEISRTSHWKEFKKKSKEQEGPGSDVHKRLNDRLYEELMSNYVKIFMERKIQQNSRTDWLKYDLHDGLGNSLSPFKSKKQNDENKPINIENQV